MSDESIHNPAREARAVLEFRQRKDSHFAAGRGPVQGAALESFSGLSYFAVDPAWRFELPLEAPAADTSPDTSPQAALATTSGEVRHMALLGSVTVPLPGGPYRLNVFAPLGDEQPASVFVPFRDQTSGQHTYGAGRYLDAPVKYSDPSDMRAVVTLDFNLAYHPYCAYSEGWTCPLPPPENILPAAVTAGERLPF